LNDSQHSGGFVQLAYFVEDIFAAAENWASTFGAGPFLVMEHIPLENVVYRGEPGMLDHSSAYGQYGSLMLELVQQNGSDPSAFMDMYTPGAYGIHHTARFAPDLDADIALYRERGHATAMRASAGELDFAFIDTRATLGHMTELYQDCDMIRGFYQLVAEAAHNWDRKETFFQLPG
jgi:hypothetical protein